MEPLFLLPGGARPDSFVQIWLEAQPGEVGDVARRWFGRIRECGGDVVELVHDGYPTACVGEAAFAYVGVFKAHVNIGFFLGAQLADPMGLLQGSGKRMRHVKLGPGANVDTEALDALIDAAYADIKARLQDFPLPRWGRGGSF